MDFRQTLLARRLALDRDRIDRTLEMDVLRMGRLRSIDIHPIERKTARK